MRLILIVLNICLVVNTLSQSNSFFLEKVKSDERLSVLRDSSRQFLYHNYETGYKKNVALISYCKKIKWKQGEALALVGIHKFFSTHRKVDSLFKYSNIIDTYYTSYLTCKDHYYYKLDCANNYYVLSKFDKVLELGRLSVKLADSCNLNKTDALITMATVKSITERVDESILAFKEAGEYALTQNVIDTPSLFMVYYNIGLLYNNKNMFDSSNIYMKKSISVLKRPNAYIIVCDNLMKQNASQHEIDLYYDTIKEFYNTNLFPNFNSMFGLISVRYYLKKGDYRRAESFADSLILMAQKNKEPYSTKVGYSNKIKAILGDRGNLVDSLSYYSDSTNILDMRKKTLELETAYETSEKEKTIAKLNEEIKDSEIKSLTFKNYLLYGSIGVVMLFFSLILIRRRRQKILQSKMEELRQQALKLQMNPHFFFNALNSINNFIIKNEKEKAQRFLSGFSKLMRLTLENSQKGLITVESEISFIEHYLQLEQQRHKNFEYKLEISDDLKDWLIPGFLIQPVVENSILHGFRNIDYTGFINISIQIEKTKIKIDISDNGVGSTKMETNSSTHKSYATKILKDRIKLYNGSVEVNSHYNTTNIHGTNVRITLPIIH